MPKSVLTVDMPELMGKQWRKKAMPQQFAVNDENVAMPAHIKTRPIDHDPLSRSAYQLHCVASNGCIRCFKSLVLPVCRGLGSQVPALSCWTQQAVPDRVEHMQTNKESKHHTNHTCRCPVNAHRL